MYQGNAPRRYVPFGVIPAFLADEAWSGALSHQERETAITAMTQLVPAAASITLPMLVTVAGGQAERRFLEFFAAAIRNPHTRRAYQRVEETRLPSCGSGWTLTTSIAASVPVATTRMAAAVPSAVVRSSRCADARARNSLGVPAPTRSRITSPRL